MCFWFPGQNIVLKKALWAPFSVFEYLTTVHCSSSESMICSKTYSMRHSCSFDGSEKYLTWHRLGHQTVSRYVSHFDVHRKVFGSLNINFNAEMFLIFPIRGGYRFSGG